jgi:hypothetical protein
MQQKQPSRPGSPAKRRTPLTPDEKVDQASRDSMDASDPPAYLGIRTGAPPQRGPTPVQAEGPKPKRSRPH